MQSIELLGGRRSRRYCLDRDPCRLQQILRIGNFRFGRKTLGQRDRRAFNSEIAGSEGAQQRFVCLSQHGLGICVAMLRRQCLAKTLSGGFGEDMTLDRAGILRQRITEVVFGADRIVGCEARAAEGRFGYCCIDVLWPAHLQIYAIRALQTRYGGSSGAGISLRLRQARQHAGDRAVLGAQCLLVDCERTLE